MGKLIVFEGIDGSGKSTQYKLLCEKLKSRSIEFMSLVFPQYSQPSSTLIKMYLGGEFGSSPGDVNPYAASSFYAVDRFASYKKVWGSYYNSGGIIITDRYTTSNAVHQASKLKADERASFFDWLYEYEFKLLGMPSPDVVIYFNIPVEIATEQLRKRQAETGTAGDIHETDIDYLQSCHEAAEMASIHYGWTVIDVAESISGQAQMRSIDSIHADVMNLVEKYLEK